MNISELPPSFYYGAAVVIIANSGLLLPCRRMGKWDAIRVLLGLVLYVIFYFNINSAKL